MSHRRLLFLKLFDGEQQEHARPVAERESCRQLPFRAPVQTQTPRVGSRPVPGWLARPRPAAGPSLTPTGHRRAEDRARLPAPGTTRTELPGVPCRARCHPTKDHVAAAVIGRNSASLPWRFHQPSPRRDRLVCLGKRLSIRPSCTGQRGSEQRSRGVPNGIAGKEPREKSRHAVGAPRLCGARAATDDGDSFRSVAKPARGGG